MYGQTVSGPMVSKNLIGADSPAPITINGSALELGAPVVLFPTRVVVGGVDTQQPRNYDVARDGRFLINTTVLDARATPPITLLMNWHPEAKK